MSEQGPQFVNVEVKPEGYAVVTICKEPVNSLDFKLWSELDRTLDSLEQDSAVNGVVFVSGLKRDVFSAGNDLLELYAPKTSYERYRDFWVLSNKFLVKLHRSRLATIAAVRGACPAGGCIISLCCDHRVMSSSGSIGLNEVLLGIPVPKFWGLLMTRLVGQKAADKLLLTGKMVTPQEAKTLGMIDQVVDKDQVLAAAERAMIQLVKLPPSAVKATKLSLREDFCKQWEAYYPTEPEGAWKFLNQPDTLKVLDGAMKRLSGKSAASKL